jgi:hypothetical protein
MPICQSYYRHQEALLTLDNLTDIFHFYREETFNNFGDKLDRKTVVHNWYFTHCD